MFPEELEARRGRMLVQRPASIGAAVGTATHKGAEAALLARGDIRGGDPVAALERAARQSLAESLIAGVIWDDTTRTKEAAEVQAIRQAKRALEVLPAGSVEVEGAYTAEIAQGFVLSGHIDIREGGRIMDIKTGTRARANQAQYGAYALLCRSNGIEIDMIGEVYVKRVGVTKTQPPAELVFYEIAEAERLAWHIIQRIMADLSAFRETGDLYSFLPNPNSMMCHEDYCPAWGTDFCSVSLGAPASSGSDSE
jgi:hypothetical protein